MNSITRVGEKWMCRSLLVLTVLMAGLTVVPVASAQVGETPYIGEILAVPFNFAPKGWATCQGQLLAISQNTALFSLLGTYYGGNGVNTFALPDLRGRTPVGMGQGPGLSRYDIGQTGGEETVTLQVSQMPAHTHTAFGSLNAGTTATPTGAVWATQTRVYVYSSSQSTQMAPQALGPAGGSQPHDNMSPYLVLNYVIALNGIYPARQ